MTTRSIVNTMALGFFKYSSVKTFVLVEVVTFIRTQLIQQFDVIEIAKIFE